MRANQLRHPLYAALVLSALVGPGCGKAIPPPGAADKAEAAVEEFLDSWSKGEPPDKFAGTHPRIIASDPDRKSGYRLLSFLSVEAKQSQDAPSHFRCRIALSLRDRKGKQVEKEVVYEVTAGEKYIIARTQR